MWRMTTCSMFALCTFNITARANEPTPSPATSTTTIPPAVVDPWTASPMLAGSGAPAEPLPAYAHLRVAQNSVHPHATPIDPATAIGYPPAQAGATPFMGETLPPPVQPLSNGQPLMGSETSLTLGAEPMDRAWPEYDVGPRWWIVPGSRNGTNPAANIRNWSLNTGYGRIEQLGDLFATGLSLRFPLAHGRAGLSLGLPYVYLDPEFADPLGGLSDLRIRLNYNIHLDDETKWTLFPMVKLYVPIKDEDWFSNDFTDLPVGYGRYVLIPALGLIWTADPQTFVAWVYSYDFDIAGSSGRSVSVSSFESGFMHEWQNGVYILPSYGFAHDHAAGGSGSGLSFELGINVNTVTFFTEGDYNLNSGPGSFEWGIEFGVRVNY
jgi:hypothetical protein